MERRALSGAPFLYPAGGVLIPACGDGHRRTRGLLFPRAAFFDHVSDIRKRHALLRIRACRLICFVLADSSVRVRLDVEFCFFLPDVLRLFRIVVDVLCAVLHVVHVEEARVVVEYGLEPDVVRLVGIHRFANDDAANADVG